MNVEIKAEAATMGVLFSHVRVVVGTVEKMVSPIGEFIALVSTFLSIGGVSLNAVAPDYALSERRGAFA